jgi:hypothetical protein
MRSRSFVSSDCPVCVHCVVALTEGSTSMELAPRGRGIIVGVMIFATLLILAYWVIWFLVDRNLLASLHTDYYYRFENAFPLADAWLGLLLILATVGLLLRRPWGLLAGLLGGGAGIYLGCMDVLFDLENGVYHIPANGDASGVIIEVVINILTFGLGILVTTYIWRNRAWFLLGAKGV